MQRDPVVLRLSSHACLHFCYANMNFSIEIQKYHPATLWNCCPCWCQSFPLSGNQPAVMLMQLTSYSLGGRDTHAHVHKYYISCPFSRFSASMMAAQNEVKCGLMESSCPIIFFSFVQLIIPLWAFFIPLTGGEWKDKADTLAALHLVMLLIMMAPPGTRNTSTHLKTLHINV